MSASRRAEARGARFVQLVSWWCVRAGKMTEAPDAPTPPHEVVLPTNFVTAQAVVFAVAASVVVVVSRVGDNNANLHRQELAEGWGGWLESFAGALGFVNGAAQNGKMQASIIPTMNLASHHSKAPLRIVKGSRLSTWVATGVENFARACGKDRDQPCPTGQSTLLEGFVASKAVDNGNQTAYAGGSCSSTDSQNNPWWKVNFQRQILVTGVKIYGRSDCCQDRMQGFDVWVGNHNYEPDANVACVTNQNAPADPDNYVAVTCSTPLKGTYLFISIPGEAKILTLCEVLDFFFCVCAYAYA